MRNAASLLHTNRNAATFRVALPLLTAALAAALVVGCKRSEAPAPAAVAPAATVAAPAKAQLGSFGVDESGMDKSVKPGDDFFAYVNGTWVKNTEIPADKSTYSAFNVLNETALANTRKIIEDAAAGKVEGPDGKKIGDYYAAYLDEAGIDAKGIAPLQPELDAIAALPDTAALSKTFGSQLRADVDVLNNTNYYTNRLFGAWITQRYDQPDVVVPYLLQGGLGMPDRDFYLAADHAAERTAYQAHVAKMLSLAGIADSDAKAAKIVALETKIAQVHATQVETNDVKTGTNPWKREEFATKAPGIDWTAFFDAAQLASQPEFIVWQPKAVAGISKLVASEPLDTWKDYLQFHAIDRNASVLPKPFREESFAFYGTTMSGTPKQQDRWKSAVNATNGALGEAVGKVYADRFFTAQTKSRADELVKNLLAAFDQRIQKAEWMSASTKARAKAKLATLKVDVGYPAHFQDYSGLQVVAGDALGNAQRASLFDYQQEIARVGKAPTRDQFLMTPQTVNALNIPLENRLVFPAAILAPPFFDPNADDAVNYGAIGSVIGHEISHSFDSSGALFDETGKMANWWTPEDFKRFEAACNALAAQYDAYEPFPGLHLNGKLTLAENVADVAGLATAYDAYKRSQEGKPAVTIDGFTPDQRFFLGFAQDYRSKYRDTALRNSLPTGTHSPGMYRAATVRNQDPWYVAFDVKPGDKLYLAPDKRVHVW
jgi:putative endopeptidase